MPKIQKCVNCNNNADIVFFSVFDDGFKCKNCGRVDKSVISICATSVDAIRYIICAPAKKIFSFDLKEEAIKEISLISKVYLKEKLEM